MANVVSLADGALRLSDDLVKAEISHAEAKERLRIVLQTKEWWEAELAIRETDHPAKNAEERKVRLLVMANKDKRMLDILQSEHARRQDVAKAEVDVNRLTREFRLALARIGLEDARLRARAVGATLDYEKREG